MTVALPPIELAARAAHRAMLSRMPRMSALGPIAPWESQPASLREDWIEAMRAALKELREPTFHTQNAAYFSKPCDVTMTQVNRVWYCMIDEILK